MTAMPMQPPAFFENYYTALRGRPPMRWMVRLFEDVIAGKPPRLVDLETGAGKTELVVIWLLALAWFGKQGRKGSPVPRRLVWVVNRRVLVQQVHEVAEKLKLAIKAPVGPIAEMATDLRSLCRQGSALDFDVVQLRGQRLDDREWALNPTMPQLIIGTVDQIGSRILFQGYGQGKWSRPMHAALFGVDAWVCVDEAHLVPAFAVTLRQVREMATRPLADAVPPVITRFFAKLPLWVTELSATPGLPAPQAKEVFRLSDEDHEDNIIADRLLAKSMRRVVWKPQPEKKHIARDMVAEALATAASQPGSAIAVFCCTVEGAKAIAKELTKKHPDRVLLVTGRIRGYERDRLEQNALFKRFRQPHPETPLSDTPPTFLVGTAAAEVGLDADASAIVCDFASLPTLVQRLGRLDRRGQLSKRARQNHAAPPTMTIIGGSNGKTTPSQLEALVAKLNSASASNSSEFRAEFFTGAPWSVVVGKEKAEKEDDEEKAKPKQPHALDEDDIIHFEGLRTKVLKSQDSLPVWIRETLGEAVLNDISESDSPDKLIDALNVLIGQGSTYETKRFSAVKLRDKTAKLRDKNPSGKNLRKFNRWLLEDAFSNEIATGAKFGKEDAVDAATWRVMNLPSATLDEADEDEDIEVSADAPAATTPERKAQAVTHEARQPAAWLIAPLAAVTSGPVVVPPLTESVLRRWAATTPRPSRFLPVHPWLYGLLPDDEGTPLVGIAFRLELDVLRFHTADDDEGEDNAAYDREWQKVCRCFTAFPPLNSELHFVPIGQVRQWLSSLTHEELGAIVHFDGDEWTDFIEPADLSAKSVLLLPTSTNPALLKDILPPGGDEKPDQRCWDVFAALAQDGAKYWRKIKITAGASRLKADKLVYRVTGTGDETASAEPANETEEAESQPPPMPGSAKWKAAGIKLSFSHRGIAFELRYFKPERGSDAVLDLLPDHLAAAAEHGRQLAEALAPGDAVLATLLGHTGQQHDIGKDNVKWQQAMGNTPAWRENEGHEDSIRIAKPVIENPGSAGGYRHEWGTLWAIRSDTTSIGEDADIAAFLRELHLHAIAAHHGYFRPSMPDRGFCDKPTAAKQNPLRLEAIERAARLQRQLGCWRLAYLETLIKVADVSASKDAENAATEDATDED